MWDLDFVDNDDFLLSRISTLILYKDTQYDFIIDFLIRELYMNSDLYHRNMSLNLVHEFTTSKEIYDKTGIYTVLINDSFWNRSVDYDVNKIPKSVDVEIYGNTDILFIFRHHLYGIYGVKFFIMDYGKIYHDDIYGDLYLSLINWNVDINVNLDYKFQHYLDLYNLPYFCEILKKSDYKYLDKIIYIPFYSTYTAFSYNFWPYLDIISNYYKDVYFVLSMHDLKYLFKNNSITLINQFVKKLSDYNIKICFFDNVTKRNRRIPFWNYYRLSLFSQCYLKQFLGVDSVNCIYKQR